LKHDNQKSDFWIGGDFNLPDMNWSSLTVTSNQYSYAMIDTYLDILKAALEYVSSVILGGL
jgi:hypothetical protein